MAAGYRPPPRCYHVRLYEGSRSKGCVISGQKGGLVVDNHYNIITLVMDQRYGSGADRERGCVSDIPSSRESVC